MKKLKINREKSRGHALPQIPQLMAALSTRYVHIDLHIQYMYIAICHIMAVEAKSINTKRIVVTP